MSEELPFSSELSLKLNMFLCADDQSSASDFSGSGSNFLAHDYLVESTDKPELPFPTQPIPPRNKTRRHDYPYNRCSYIRRLHASSSAPLLKHAGSPTHSVTTSEAIGSDNSPHSLSLGISPDLDASKASHPDGSIESSRSPLKRRAQLVPDGNIIISYERHGEYYDNLFVRCKDVSIRGFLSGLLDAFWPSRRVVQHTAEIPTERCPEDEGKNEPNELRTR